MSQPYPERLSPFHWQLTPAFPPDARQSARLREVADRLVAQGIDAARSGHRGEALRLFDQALRIAPDHLEALLWRGGLSEPGESLTYLERAFALDPDNPQVREGLAWARMRAGLEELPASPTPQHVTAPEPSASDPVQPVAQPARPATAIVHVGRHIRQIAFLAVLFVGLVVATTVARAALDRSESALTPMMPNLGFVLGVPATPTPVEPTATATPTVTPTPTASPSELLDQAWRDEDWPRVLALVEDMVKAAPADGELKEKLFAAHYNYAMQLVRNEQWVEAIGEFDKALTVNIGDPRAEGQRRLAQLYHEGSLALSKGDFAAAITPLRTVYDENRDYQAVKARLYQAYIGYADALEKAGKSGEAYLTYQKAVAIDDQGTEAQAGMTRLKGFAPAPTAAGKKIEVDIAKQQVIVWQDNQVIWRFKASTGKAPYLTRTGNFKILDKMPNAYSSAMQWGMPWWMGIYYAGKWENGFHAMARVGKNQIKLSDSVLGRPATHGCIMLSDKDAKTLYDWAVVGTPVWIH